MTWRRSLALLIAGTLLGCSSGDQTRPDVDDWRGLIAVGDGASAERALRRELDSGVGRPDLAPFLGEAELQQGNVAEAESWLGAGEFSPKVAAHGFHMLGRLRMMQADLPAAGKAFDRALADDPNDAELWVDIGRLRWVGGEQVEALQAAKKAIAVGPDNPSALLFRAQLMRDAQGNGAALPLLEKGLQVAPANPDLLAELAATLGEAGRSTEMLEVVRRLSRAAPGDRRVFYLQALLAARAGQYDFARLMLERSGDLDRKAPAAILLLAIVDMENGNYASASQGLDTLSREQPDNLRVSALLARALALSGNHRELVTRFGKKKESPYIASLVARSYEVLGDRAKAAPFLDSAMAGGRLRLAPIAASVPGRRAGDGAVVIAATRLALENRGAKEAKRRTARFLAQHPGSSDALVLAGDAALAADDPRAAFSLYDRAAKVRRTWSLTKKMAVALDRSGKSGRATALIDRHLAGEPSNADAAIMLARRLYDSGERERANALVAYARSRGRNDPLLDRLTGG